MSCKGFPNNACHDGEARPGKGPSRIHGVASEFVGIKDQGVR